MKILIVEDDPQVAEVLAELFRIQPPIQSGARVRILEATNLDDAVVLLDQADAVLCDGTFPTGRESVPLRPGGSRQSADDFPTPESRIATPRADWNSHPRLNWPQVAGLAEQRGIPFVLFSGDEDEVIRAKLRGLAAFSKPFGAPAAIAHLLSAIPDSRLATPESSSDATGEP